MLQLQICSFKPVNFVFCRKFPLLHFFLFGMKVLSITFIICACYSKNIMCVFLRGYLYPLLI